MGKACLERGSFTEYVPCELNHTVHPGCSASKLGSSFPLTPNVRFMSSKSWLKCLRNIFGIYPHSFLLHCSHHGLQCRLLSGSWKRYPRWPPLLALLPPSDILHASVSAIVADISLATLQWRLITPKTKRNSVFLNMTLRAFLGLLAVLHTLLPLPELQPPWFSVTRLPPSDPRAVGDTLGSDLHAHFSAQMSPFGNTGLNWHCPHPHHHHSPRITLPCFMEWVDTANLAC